MSERIELDSVYDLEKLDDRVERGDEVTLHYRSHRSSDGRKEVARTARYRRHIAEGWLGRLTVEDGRQTIELDREKAKQGKLFLLSKGGDRAVRLGYLEALSVPEDNE